MSKKIILTGCAGFIGYHTSLLYLKKGYKVLGIDNINDSYDKQLKKKRLNHLKRDKNFIFKKCDIENLSKLENIFKFFNKGTKPIAIINLAAKTGVRKSTSEPRLYFQSNLMGALNIAQCALKFKINKIVHASTSSVYGNSNEKSFSVDSETSSPVSNYAASKKSSEVLMHAINKIHKINITILRFFTVYGPFGRPDMSPFIFIESNLRKKQITLYGDGNQKRDFTYVDDIATGIFKSQKLKGFNILNLGNNRPIKINNLLNTIKKLSNTPNKIKKTRSLLVDVKYTSANIDKTFDLIKWEPSTKFEIGVSKTFKWHQENRKWLKKIKI